MQVEVFLFEGCYFLGSLSDAEARYKATNPSKKFFIWVCDNFTELKPIK